jgi:hypothetical protein
MNEIIEIKNRVPSISMSESDVKAQVALIQRVMSAVMKEGTHYGVIPGCKQPSLYKAGSEVLLTTFRIAVDPEIINLSTDDEIRYQVRAKGIHQGTGILVGVGIGECSSNEEKYKWRKAVCDEEFDATPENRRRIKFTKYERNGRVTIYQNKQIRTEPADQANTVLKMAKKRAQIDLTITATGASDIFTQDIEDLPPELINENKEEQGSPIDHPEMKAAKTNQELSKIMNSFSTEDKKKYAAYYNKRREELAEVSK